MSAVALQSATRAPEGGSQTAIDLEKLPVDKVLAQLAVKPEGTEQRRGAAAA